MKFIVGFFLIAVLLSSCFTNFAFAKTPYDVKYETLENRLEGIPKFCILEPQKDPIIPIGMSDWMMKATDAGIDAWVGPLKSTSTHDAKWDVEHVRITLDKQSTYDYSKCDVVVAFKKSATKNFKNPEFILGVQYIEKGKNHVDIFYQDISVCERVEKDERVGELIYSYSCPTEALKPIPVLEAIVRHEIGHALGLGHYISQEQITLGVFAPSIMVPIIPLLGNPNGNTDPKNLNIMPVDFQKLKEIYGDKGWGFKPQITKDEIQKILNPAEKNTKKIEKKIVKPKVTKPKTSKK